MGAGSPGVLQGDQKAGFTGTLGWRNHSLGMLAQLEARKGEGVLSLEREAEQAVSSGRGVSWR